jgi:glycosyltransferase involved in cell wall biosynthesis
VFTDKSQKIAVMLIVKDEPAIEITLSILQSQCVDIGAECVVVDASQGRLDDIKQRNPWVKWIDYEQPSDRTFTIAHQRNLAVESTSASILLFCDAGGTPSPHWVLDLSLPLLSGSQSLVGGPVLNTSSDAISVGENFQETGEILDVSTTANIAFTRGAFNLAGGFNEHLNYGSDADFIWKLEAKGILHTCVSGAVMGLDGGDFWREQKRSWRYGKAIIDLFELHPSKRKSKYRSNPELWVYRLLICLWGFSILLTPLNPVILLAPIMLTVTLVLKNSKESRPFRIVYFHYVYGLGMIVQQCRKLFLNWRLSKILIFPNDTTRYTTELTESLALNGESVGFFPRLSPSASLSILLLPFISPILLLRGSRIIHIHWLYSFSLLWTKQTLFRVLSQIWFYIWIISLRLSGIKIVYTVHNMTPHDAIFYDDKQSCNFLERQAMAIVVLNELSLSIYQQKFPGKILMLIPEGPLGTESNHSREAFRRFLKVEKKELVVLTGNLRPYKGIDVLINSISSDDERFAFRIAGYAVDEYRTYLQKVVANAQIRGVDIEIAYNFLNENDYGGYLLAADYFCVPFTKINNSGSVNAALCAGVPVIIPNIPELDWVPTAAKSDFARGFAYLPYVGSAEYDAMVSACADWKESQSWSMVSELHIECYREVVR